jgi:hypothetical protein
VAKYDYKGNIAAIDTAVSFNVQRVILLNDPDKSDKSLTENEDDKEAQSLGVEGIKEEAPKNIKILGPIIV